MVDFRAVLWVGGSSGAGKSTVSRLLARRHGLRCYSVDTATWSHRERAMASGDDRAIAWSRLSPHQRAELTPVELAGLDFDRSPWIRADLRQLPNTPPVIAEGTEIGPQWVPADGAAVWLMATPAIRSERTTERGWGTAGGAVDMVRAARLDQSLRDSARTRIDTAAHAAAAVAVQIEAAMSDWFAANPGVTAPDARCSLRREYNASLVEQYYAGWRHLARDPDPTVVRVLECECSDPSCTEFVTMRIAELPHPRDDQSAAVLADRHDC